MFRQRDTAMALAVLSLGLGLGAAVTAFADADGGQDGMGSISIPAGEHTGDVSTVNGSIHIGAGAVVGRAHTVDGSIGLDPHATALELVLVNGSVHLHKGARVTGAVRTGNGSIWLDNEADVADGLRNINGRIHVDAAHVNGGIETVGGSVELGPNTHVEGGIHVRKEGESATPASEPPRVVIGPHAVVSGTLAFDRPVRLYVSDRATIGPVEGATPIRFSGARPPGD